MKYIAGIDVGGTSIKAGLLDHTGKIYVEKIVEITTEKGAIKVAEQIKNIVAEMIFEIGTTKENILGIGVGMPGPTNSDTGVVSFIANIPGWEPMYPFAEKLAELTELPVKVGNDVNVAAMGESWIGAAQGYSNVLVLTLGTGIGGGIVVNNKLISGSNGAAAEVGHMKIKSGGKLFGKLCGCGQHGCWEAYCSALALAREARMRLEVSKKDTLLWELIEGDISKVNAKHIFDAAKQGDEFAMCLVDYELNYLAKGLSIIVTVLNPGIVIIGGGMSLAGDILFNGLKERMTGYTLPVCYENLKIVPSALGNKSGIIGATALFAMYNDVSESVDDNE